MYFMYRVKYSSHFAELRTTAVTTRKTLLWGDKSLTLSENNNNNLVPPSTNVTAIGKCRICFTPSIYVSFLKLRTNLQI